jgi:bifunctional UDP-N-acetylglucosamine pyrophosphorylase/glucosamine-1-phosphate N-acetyltransferase
VSFTAVVMAAGQGTRMRSKTPKVLHDLCGRPMVHWPVLAAQEAGAGSVVVVGSPDGALEGHLPDGVSLAVQPVPDGTGGAVAAAVDAGAVAPGQPVVVLSGDVPLVTAPAIRALVDAHLAADAAATMATTLLDDPSGYGRVVRAPDGTVERVVETKAAGANAAGDATEDELAIREVNTGIFCFDGAALLDALPRVGTDNAQGERYLPEVLPILRADGRTVAAHVVDDPGLVLGVNDRAHLAQVRAIAQARILEAHMVAGVTIVNPPSTVIDAAVEIGPDTTIEPSTVLRGSTRIGAGATVGPCTTLIDTGVGDGARVLHAYATGAEVGPGASVGPFAYLRPGAVLRERSKIGTFVEVKNSEIGAGTKVPHLSYIGDADVGEGTNLGAATITANYDGFVKHRTTIGAGVRSSVDVSFVAPVTVGDGAYTAAGSVITDDVPPGALGIARERQTNIEGYAERREQRQPKRS